MSFSFLIFLKYGLKLSTFFIHIILDHLEKKLNKFKICLFFDNCYDPVEKFPNS